MANRETYDEVHVLSLPGFVWKKADYAPTSPRDCMSCIVAGQRQMVTFGGIDRMKWNDNSTDFFRDPDTFPQGVGVFDLTDMTWKDEYNADASSYDSPEAIKTWYNEGLGPPAFSGLIKWEFANEPQQPRECRVL